MMFGLSCPIPPPADISVAEGDKITLGEISINCMHTPGHSPGHLAYYIERHDIIFSGDLIFQGSIGRTDFPGCSEKDMKLSLERLKKMPRETVICPGHMGITTIGDELDSNPFLND